MEKERKKRRKYGWMEIMKENNGEKKKMEKEWKEGNMDGWNQGGRLKRRKHGRKDGNRERMQ